MAVVETKPRAIVYIDGYNLYYGMAKPLNCKWVNLEKAFVDLLSKHMDVVKINFFTSWSIDQGSKRRQVMYVSALRSLPLLTVHLGRHQMKTHDCLAPACPHNYSYQKPQEKKTDVKIAVEMVADAFEHNCEVQVLVSGDTDLVPAVEMVRTIPNAPRVWHFAPSLGDDVDKERGKNIKELRDACHLSRNLPASALLMSQLRCPHVGADGVSYDMPREWTYAKKDALEKYRLKLGLPATPTTD